MDVYPYFILFFIITSVIQEAHQAANTGSTKGETENNDGLSPREPDVCRVEVECSKDSPSSALFGRLSDEQKTKGIPGEPGVNGTKGEQGIQGAPGINGTKGEQGIQGVPGLNGTKGEQGIQGIPGLNGTKGEQGIQGMPGLNGTKGEKGIQGIPGVNGTKGEQGIQGIPGLNGTTGEQGPKGEKGEKGADCTPDSLGPLGGEHLPRGAPGKSVDNPVKSCRDLIIDGDIPSLSESSYVNNDDPFEVICDFEKQQTCLKLDSLDDSDLPGKLVTVDPGRKHQEYLLTEKPFNINSFYGINHRQLKWFQLQAKTKITQVIKFHCFNMVVKSSNLTKNLQLLSWNQRIINIKGAEHNGFSYEILSIPDECEEFEGGAEPKPKYNEIKLEGYPEYLPVFGFKIRHIQPAVKQSFYVETIQLCADF